MARIDPRRDGVVIALLVGFVALLAAALTGATQTFAYGLVVVLGIFVGLGFIRRHDPLTWAPPVLAVLTLLIAFAGMFANQDVPVTSAADTVGGFQAASAYLVYGLWIPAFVTMGVGFSLLFDRLSDDVDGSR
jgi:hypothetical protein